MSGTVRLCKECRGAVEAPARICAECQNERSIEKGEAARRTERRKFAAMALQGMLANPRVYEEQSAKNVLSDAVGMAEALIAELDKAEKK